MRAMTRRGGLQLCAAYSNPVNSRLFLPVASKLSLAAPHATAASRSSRGLRASPTRRPTPRRWRQSNIRCRQNPESPRNTMRIPGHAWRNLLTNKDNIAQAGFAPSWFDRRRYATSNRWPQNTYVPFYAISGLELDVATRVNPR